MRQILYLLMCAVIITAGISIVSAETYLADEEPAREVLNALSIDISGTGIANDDEALTRGETAELIVKMLGISHLLSDLPSYGSKQYFKDVPANSDKSAYINLAYEVGVMSGNDGFFYPDDPITAEQFTTVVVRALGYDIKAVSLGGYPSGYYYTALELGILKNNEMSELTIARSTVYKILLRALKTNLMTKGYDYKQGEYTVSTNTHPSLKYLMIAQDFFR